MRWPGTIPAVRLRGRVIRDRNYGWAELMKRVFDLDVLQCPGCGGRMKVIAEIEDPVIARKILEHLGLPADELGVAEARGPPVWDEAEEEGPLPVTDEEWL